MGSAPNPPRNPFIAGSWVRGDDFFGRSDLIREALEGERHALWVLGGRRLGKTSLLKELEYRVQRSRETPFVALFWDLQGTATWGLMETLLSSVEDSGRSAAPPTSTSRTWKPAHRNMLAAIVRRTVHGGWRLLLLVDEAESPVVGRADPGVPRPPRLARAEVRTVITATRSRASTRTSMPPRPSLQGFIPPTYLTPLRRGARPRRPRRLRPRRRRPRPRAHRVPPVPAPAAGEPALREPGPGRHPRPARRGRDDRELLLG
jgi:hypothetical protein